MLKKIIYAFAFWFGALASAIMLGYAILGSIGCNGCRDLPERPIGPCRDAVYEVPMGQTRGCRDHRHHARVKRHPNGHETWICTCER